MIDRNDGHAWLTEFANCEISKDHSAADSSDSESEGKKIQAVFDQWLKAEAESWTSDSSDPARTDALDRWWAIADPDWQG